MSKQQAIQQTHSSNPKQEHGQTADPMTNIVIIGEPDYSPHGKYLKSDCDDVMFASIREDETHQSTIIERKKAESMPESRASPPPVAYRPDIDGLRTIAVVAVVVFHAWPKAFPGGFIGVDIFFVISGYLISGIIFKQHLKKSFTYKNFYSRRIRRIFPSLIVVLATTLVLGCIWLLKVELKALASTLLAGTVFGANLQILTLKGGYFAVDVKQNALLHLWSLGVEEQYYILWPFFAALVIRAPKKGGLLMLFLLAGVSFGLNVGFIAPHPKFSFYSPLCRFWQMAAGSILAFFSLDQISLSSPKKGLNKIVALLLSLGGLGLFAVGFALLHEDKAFPGWWALLPTLGAVAIIWAGNETPINRYVLGSPPFVFIGKISYDLYLWHWPLLVFSRILYPNEDSRPICAQPYMMVAAAFILSVLTYYLLENQIRHRKSKLVVPILAGLMIVLAIMGAVIMKQPQHFSLKSVRQASVDLPPPPPPPAGPPLSANNGTNSTSSKSVLNSSKGPRIEMPTVAKVNAGRGDWEMPPKAFGDITDDSPFMTPSKGHWLNEGQKETIVVLGDSHSNMVAHRFVKLYEDAKAASKKFRTVVYKTLDGTPPMICHEAFPAHFDMINKVKPTVVLIVTNWSQWIRPGGAASDPLHDELRCCSRGYSDNCEYQSPKDADEILRHFFGTVHDLTAKGIKVFVATLNPEGESFNPYKMADASGLVQSNLQPVSLSGYRKDHADLIQKVESGIQGANATMISFADNMCWEDVCQVVEPHGHPIMKDKDHFRPFFARNYIDTIDPVVDAALS